MTSGISIIDKSYMNFPYAHINWGENTVKWWSTANDGQGAQLNESGRKYFYIGIG